MLVSMPRAVTPRARSDAEQLAAAAADVDDVARTLENREILLDAEADLGRRPTEAILEADVGHRIDRTRECVRRRRRVPLAASRASGPRSSSRLIACRSAARPCQPIPNLGSAEAPILGVHVGRDGLQVLQQQRLESHDRLQLGLHRLAKAHGGSDSAVVALGGREFKWSTTAALNSACRLERRADQPPDEPGKAAFQRPIDRASPAGRIFQRSFIAASRERSAAERRRRQRGGRRERAVERRQRVVVDPVGRQPLALQAGDEIVERLEGHASAVPASVQQLLHFIGGRHAASRAEARGSSARRPRWHRSTRPPFPRPEPAGIRRRSRPETRRPRR